MTVADHAVTRHPAAGHPAADSKPEAEAGPGSGRHARRRPEDGQVVPLMAAVLVIVALLGIGAAELGQRVVERSRAQNAADAAALGAALQPDAATAEQVASVLARRNTATLVSVDGFGDTRVVRVRSGSVEAVAAARPVPARSLSPGSPAG